MPSPCTALPVRGRARPLDASRRRCPEVSELSRLAALPLRGTVLAPAGAGRLARLAFPGALHSPSAACAPAVVHVILVNRNAAHGRDHTPPLGHHAPSGSLRCVNHHGQDTIVFYSNSPYSNFYRSPMMFRGRKRRTSFMIAKATTWSIIPHGQPHGPRPSRMGRNVLKNGTTPWTREDVASWNAAAWMKEVLREKFTQNLHLKDQLLREFDGGPGAFAEVTPDDCCGPPDAASTILRLPSSSPGRESTGALLTELRNEWYFVDDE